MPPSAPAATVRPVLWTVVVQWLLAIGCAALVAGQLSARQHREWTGQFKSQCEKFTRSSQWPKLEVTARQWTTWDPQSGDAWLFLAEAVKHRGDLEATNACLGHVPDDYPNILTVLESQSDLLFSELNRPLEAQAVWKRMLRLEPAASSAHQRLIYYQAMTQQRSQLLEQIAASIDHGADRPEFFVYWMLADALQFSDGMFQTSKWLQGAPDDEALQVAQAFYFAKKSDTGSIPLFGTRIIAHGPTDLIEAMQTKYPQNPQVLAFFIEQAIYLGETDRVAELLDQMPATAESDSRFWRYQAWYLSATDQTVEAEAAARRSLELYPLGWRTWLELSKILRASQQTQAAEQAAENARIGKELERSLLTIPNAAEVDETLARGMLAYAKRTDAKAFVAALSRRMKP
jgi:tetratricopeptide (TPR) repeat protein